jgi:hypothetical protein
VRNKNRPIGFLPTILALVVFAVACASPFADSTVEGADSPALNKDLAVPADPGQPDLEPGAAESESGKGGAGSRSGKSKGPGGAGDTPASGGGSSPTSGGGSGGGGDTPTSGGGTSSSGPEFTTIGSLKEPGGDVGRKAPAYADVVSVVIEDAGELARISVTMAGPLPTSLDGGEVEGVGVDLFRDRGDFQVFASGERDGWFGYLYTPDGFVKYPGSFEIAGDTMSFTLRWDSMGGRGAGDFSAFVDWSGPGPQGDNPFSQDLAPESGTQHFSL